MTHVFEVKLKLKTVSQRSQVKVNSAFESDNQESRIRTRIEKTPNSWGIPSFVREKELKVCWLNCHFSLHTFANTVLSSSHLAKQVFTPDFGTPENTN